MTTNTRDALQQRNVVSHFFYLSQQIIYCGFYLKRGKDSAANPVLLSYYEKKCKNKPAKVAQAASMHKLVFIVFAVLRDQMPFELKTPEQHAVEQGFVKAA